MTDRYRCNLPRSPIEPATAANNLEPMPWRPGPLWAGKTVAIMASGPSITLEQTEAVLLAGVPAIAINTTYRLAPWAELLYACDHKWWRWENGAPDFRGLKGTQDKSAALEFGLYYIRGDDQPGLSATPGLIHTGGNSGFQALNLAALLGARRILLLGYDMKIAANGASHWHGDHPDGIRSGYKNWLPVFARAVPDLARAGLEVINCTPDSALTCFPYSDIEAML